jgi:predicted GNAT superfamily acetyltransferase
MEKHNELAKINGIDLIKWNFNPYSVKLVHLYFNKYSAQVENKCKENMYLKKPGNTLNEDRIIAFLDLNNNKEKKT